MKACMDALSDRDHFKTHFTLSVGITNQSTIKTAETMTQNIKVRQTTKPLPY